MTRLSVNINKIATIRNARGGTVPDVVKAAVLCQGFGAQGITVHPRPDERHIRFQDVRDIRPVITTEFNMEGYPSRQFLDLVREVRPHQVTLVPDSPDVLTSNQGWNVTRHEKFLADIVAELRGYGIRTSLFVDADPDQIERAALTGTNRIELYTEPYAVQFPVDPYGAVAPFVRAAVKAAEAGLGLNAGHDLNLENLKFFKEHIPGLLEVSIGHALISDALYLGLEKTIRLYLEQIA
ncbi:MAG: pyridoxine 5'-phosphate synthase [Spirochaetes bacterium]|nr:MAG: pyridoxine 5'-phosphate synthase [Spirochaetota bacterium]